MQQQDNSTLINAIKKATYSITNHTKIYESFLLVESGTGDFSQSFYTGNRTADSPFVMASITKMFTTSCILMLVEDKKISLNDRISKYIEESILVGLHVYNEKDYSFDLTISHLLFQNSGLPDYFEESGIKNQVIIDDKYISFEEIITLTKQIKPHFPPGHKTKAHYADIHFDLLGYILEQIVKQPIHLIFESMLFQPLGMKRTYLPVSESDFIPNIYYNDRQISCANIVRSSKASGGCISTATDLMLFLKAFYTEKLFSHYTLANSTIYRKLQSSMGPLYYGGGFMRMNMKSILTLFMGKGELLGHTGTTGSFAFYYPAADYYFVGDLNQIADPSLPIKLAMKLAFVLGKQIKSRKV